jgi:aflatoxin B1 aldehyde reductase
LYDYAQSKNYILPTVYEGYYNPVGRHAESELLPLLRKLNISFYAYGTLAGGFLVKSPQDTIRGSKGRWDKKTSVGQMHWRIYGGKESLLEGLQMWEAIAEEFGIPKTDMCYRWAAFNSHLSKDLGDGIVLGASTPQQLQQLLEALGDGPLDERVVARIDEVWRVVREEAVLDNFNKEG